MAEQRSGERVAQRITIDEFTEVTLNAVLRAAAERKFRPGPIIIGIVIWPPEVGSLATAGASTPR